MRIPKNKMPVFINAIDLLLSIEEDQSEEEKEMFRQVRDRAALCLHGDGVALDIEVAYK